MRNKLFSDNLRLLAAVITLMEQLLFIDRLTIKSRHMQIDSFFVGELDPSWPYISSCGMRLIIFTLNESMHEGDYEST